MTSPWSRLAGLTAALALAACAPRVTDVVDPTPDAGAPEDAGGDASGDGPRCIPGGKTALLPVTIACAQPTPARLAVDDVNVYWTVQTGGAIVMKAPVAGGAAIALVNDDGAAVGLAVDATFVYYTQPSLGRVMRVPIVGGRPTVLAAKQDWPLFLALDGGAVYWTGGQQNGVVVRLALPGGTDPGATAPVTLIDGQTRPRAIAARDGFVYWTDFNDGTLLRIPATAAEGEDAGVRTATRLASGLRGPGDLALAGGFAYLPDQAGRVARVPLAGGALETVADVAGVPFGVATDGASLYWSTLGAGGIFRAPVAGGGRVDTIFAPERDPHFLAVGEAVVFWGAWGAGGAVKRAAK